MDPFEHRCPSPVDEGINEGFQDGLIAGRKEGLKEGFREGFKNGKEFGTRLGNLLVPLIQIIKSADNEISSYENTLTESARKLIAEIGNISLKNEEDLEKELRISQIEAKIKVLTVNFSKRFKDSSIQIFRINKSAKDEFAF